MNAQDYFDVKSAEGGDGEPRRHREGGVSAEALKEGHIDADDERERGDEAVR